MNRCVTKGGKKNMDNDEEMQRAFVNFLDQQMDFLAEATAKDISERIISNIEGLTGNSREFDKRKILIYEKIISRLEEHINKANGSIEVK